MNQLNLFASPQPQPAIHSPEAIVLDPTDDAALLADATGIKIERCLQILDAFDSLKDLGSADVFLIEKRSGCTTRQAEKVYACLQFGKNLARSHADRAKITSPSDVADLMMSKLRYLQKEIVCVLCLDTKGQVTRTGRSQNEDLLWGSPVLAEAQVFEGTLNASVFHPREIFRFAIEESANSIILVHNHPSGDPQPSQEDIRATKQLIEAGNQIGIKVLDHVIIGDGIFVSLKEENFI